MSRTYDHRLLQPVGLHNNGATCWFNSFIQCILSFPGIKEVLLADTSSNNIMKDALIKVFQCTSSTYNPQSLHTAFITTLREKSTSDNLQQFGYNQEDAQEGITLFLDMLNIDSISHLFRHRYKVTTYCRACQTSSMGTSNGESKDNNYYFSIHSSNLVKRTLGEYIYKNATSVADYVCNSCKCSGRSIRIYQLSYISPIVMILFEKYQQKVLIPYPMEFEIKSKSSTPHKYRAVAQVEHSGSTHGGHYWAIAQRKDGVFTLNDKKIAPGSLTSTTNTYLVFYQLV